MPFDGIVTAAVVHELNALLSDGRIDKVYQPDQQDIILSVHRGKDKYKVLLSANSSDARIQLVSQTPPNPAQPPTFCMLLRKHIHGARIRQVTQIDSERVVEFHLDSFNELGYPITKKLIVEIMGKHSNITLVNDETGRILDAIKKISFDVNRYRQLLPGMPYVYPPKQDKTSVYELDKETFEAGIQGSPARISKALVNSVMGFSTFFAISLCSQARVDDDAPCSTLSRGEIDRLWRVFSNYAESMRNGEYTPTVWQNEEQAPVDFHCFDRRDYSAVYEPLRFDSIGEAEEYYYRRKRTTNTLKQRSADLERILKTALDKLYLKKSKLAEDLLRAENADEFRLRGELLFANLHLLKQGQTSADLEDYYTGEPVRITLDPKLSPSENAQKYYKKYNKLKTALVQKDIQLKETEKEIEYLEATAQLLENAREFSDISQIRSELVNGGYIRRRNTGPRQKPAATPPHEYRTSEGFRILAGRNNVQNDQLTLKTAGGKDLWFHTKDIPGTHVILFTEGKEPSEQSLAEAAAVAAYYSKGKMSANVPVDYCLVKYVRKPNGAKPGMVIFDHNRTLYVDPALPPGSAETQDVR
ncbi:MAG: NFACT family protein [Firmicutes bacterium]|nr:NFACT family protein [Bacillota bacterium]